LGRSAIITTIDEAANILRSRSSAATRVEFSLK
jgi:hypothetical protein